MRKKYKFTEEEMVEFFDYMKNATAVAIFRTIHFIEETGQGKEAIEDLEKRFQENLDRLGNNASKKVLKIADEIASVTYLRSLDEMRKKKESE